MTRMFVATQVRVQKAIERLGDSEKGQGTLEYIGILVIAALLIAAVVGTMKAWDPTETVQKWIDDIKKNVS